MLEMKSKLPFSILIVAVCMKGVSMALSVLAKIVGALHMFGIISVGLSLLSKLCNLGFIILSFIFIFKLFKLFAVKMRDSMASVQPPVSEQDVSHEETPPAVTSVSTYEASPAKYTGRQADGF